MSTSVGMTEGRRAATSHLLAALGAALLLGSWVTQNFLVQKWAAERARLEFTTIVNAALGAQWATWSSLLLQWRSTPPKDFQTFDMAVSYNLNITLHILKDTRETAQLYGVPTGAMGDGEDSVLRQVDSLLSWHQHEKLALLADSVSVAAVRTSPQVTRDINVLYSEVVDSEARYNRIFLGCYLAGSVVVGAGALVGWRLRNAGRRI